ncbi:hypothetical protein [Shimia sp.]|uniref:hypothetical protein n=1 Tax=Shimia sp. TaxID=1954381 RepID=UPI003566E432
MKLTFLYAVLPRQDGPAPAIWPRDMATIGRGRGKFGAGVKPLGFEISVFKAPVLLYGASI